MIKDNLKNVCIKSEIKDRKSEGKNDIYGPEQQEPQFFI